MQHAQHQPSPVSSARFARPKKNVATLPLQRGMRVADFGAGSGAYVLAIAEWLQGSGTVYAIDVQRDLLRRILSEAARCGLKNVEVIWADLEASRASKLADASTDLVLISNLLFQVPNKSRIFREARRIVKGEGYVVVIDWRDSYGGIGPIKEDVVTKKTALDSAKKEGLELLREFEAGAHHYGLILRPIAKSL